LGNSFDAMWPIADFLNGGEFVQGRSAELQASHRSNSALSSSGNITEIGPYPKWSGGECHFCN
jgi:hypothetical protein